MHSFVIYIAIFCILALTTGKPLRPITDQNRDTGEAEYENKEESTAEEYSQDDQESSMESQEVVRNSARRDTLQENARLPEISNNPYKQNVHNCQTMHLANFDNFSEMTGTNRDVRNDKISNTNIDSDVKPAKFQQPDVYIKNNEKETNRHFNDNNLKFNHAQNPGYDNSINNRPMLSVSANDEGELLFENKDQVNKLDKGGYPREVDEDIPSRYKQLYNIPNENREFTDYKKYEKMRLNANRDRRQAQKTNLKESNESTPIGDATELDTINEDEETAIKRHVKKLSGQELEELFNTLSEDKRNLLKRIMENDIDNENEALNKREITKKAGAVEQINYIENGQLDSNKIQGVSSNVDDVNTEPSISRETTEANKRTMSVTEIGDVMHSKNSPSCEKAENKHELTNQNEEVKEVKAESNLDLDSKKSDNDSELESNSQALEKTENKREANFSEMTNIGKSSDDSQTIDGNYSLKDFDGSVNNQEMFLHDDKLSELMNEETERHNSYKNSCKREVSLDDPSEFSDSMKSLEESFPNSYDESNTFSGSDMAPLVRVKRKDSEGSLIKRSANVIADSNVPYFPNKGENDDEDNDEGSEFDEDGFYDRTSNYARNNENNKPLESHCGRTGEKVLTQNSLNNYGNENLESDSVNLGSDTDNVMTSVEGVNDNLMYSGLRNRRNPEDNDNSNNASDNIKNESDERQQRSTPLVDNEVKTAFDTYVNVPGYQENDAFGPLPRNYEGDLGRYKRIRRVKQPPLFQENPSLNE
ncbi:putative uncharacterized protein DDB_G0282133 [Battus philenor]|uniref:putative uncharacterized protein DDB_G0282133 n=1 Tax=Battus philenor TaxID=42288 RepID=UPI0035CFEB15